MEQDIFIQTLGQTIQALRKDKGLSQEVFANVVGVHRTFMGHIERGERNITIKSLLKVCKALGLKPSKLLEMVEKS